MSRNDHSPDRPSGRQPAPEGTHAVIVIGSFRRWLSGTTRECRGVDHKDDPPAAVETDSSRLRPSLPPSAGERVSIACSRPIAFGHIPSRRGAGPPAIAVGLPAVIHSRRIFRKSGHDPSCRVAPFVASPHSLAHYEWPNNAPVPRRAPRHRSSRRGCLDRHLQIASVHGSPPFEPCRRRRRCRPAVAW